MGVGCNQLCGIHPYVLSGSYSRSACQGRSPSPVSRKAIISAVCPIAYTQRPIKPRMAELYMPSTCKRTLGFFLKYPSSNTASGKGKFSAWRFAYSPVSGLRKSGMPAEVDMPAPVKTTMFFAASQFAVCRGVTCRDSEA